MIQRSKSCKSTLLVLALSLSSVPAWGAACCVSCGGIVLCGEQVSTPCGECNSSPGIISANRAPDFAAPIKSLDLQLSIGKDKDKRQIYSIKGSDGVTIKDEKNGESYFVQPRSFGSSSDPSELNVKKIYSLLGLQLSFDYGSIKLQQKSTGDPLFQAGPISIWSAKYNKKTKSPGDGF
jgi:hypothetical protein